VDPLWCNHWWQTEQNRATKAKQSKTEWDDAERELLHIRDEVVKVRIWCDFRVCRVNL